MSYYDKVSNSGKNDDIVEAILYFDSELEEAKKDVLMTGYYQKLASMLPGQMEYRYSQLQEVEAILEYLTIKKDRMHSLAFKKYLETYNRDLSSRDADRYASADKDVFEMSILINRISLIKNKFSAIIKGLEYKHFQLTNLVKLKTSGFEDYYIDL